MLSLPLLSPSHISMFAYISYRFECYGIYEYQYVFIFYSCRFLISHVFIINCGCFLILVCFHFSFLVVQLKQYVVVPNFVVAILAAIYYSSHFNAQQCFVKINLLLFLYYCRFLISNCRLFQFCGCFLISACRGSTINCRFSYPYFLILSPFTHIDMLSFFVLVVFNMLSFFLLLSFSRQNTLSFLIW